MLRMIWAFFNWNWLMHWRCSSIFHREEKPQQNISKYQFVLAWQQTNTPNCNELCRFASTFAICTQKKWNWWIKSSTIVIAFRRCNSVPSKRLRFNFFRTTKTKVPYSSSFTVFFCGIFICLGVFMQTWAAIPQMCRVGRLSQILYYKRCNCSLKFNGKLQPKTNLYNDALMSFRPFIYVVRVSISCLLVFVHPNQFISANHFRLKHASVTYEHTKRSNPIKRFFRSFCISCCCWIYFGFRMRNLLHFYALLALLLFRVEFHICTYNTLWP